MKSNFMELTSGNIISFAFLIFQFDTHFHSQSLNFFKNLGKVTVPYPPPPPNCLMRNNFRKRGVRWGRGGGGRAPMYE
jgi:hypothetical protein